MKTVIKPRMVSRFRRSRLVRVTTAVMIAGQVLAGAPVFAQDTARAVVKISGRAFGETQRKVAKARVRVNRTVPKVVAANLDPTFGLNVSTAGLRSARLLPERLIPLSEPTVEQNAALARTLNAVAVASSSRRLELLDQYIHEYPTSPWRASLVANAGTLYARDGYFSRAAAYWSQAWELSRDSDDVAARVLADYALGESVEQMVTFGQVARLSARLDEAKARDIRGSAGGKVSDAREGLTILREKHETAMFSGPEALKMFLTAAPIANLDGAVRTIAAYHPSVEGTSLVQLRDLAASVGLTLEMWATPVGVDFPVPSVVHLRSQHFSAIVEYRDGRYRLRDPALGGDIWISADALQNESSGFVLAPRRPAGTEWRPALAGEAAAIVGHCTPGKPTADDPPCPNCGGGGPGGPGGMPHYSFHPSVGGLVIDDAPVGYTPPIGPDMTLRLSYNHRDSKQPSTFGYGHVGNLWTFNWLSYVVDNNNSVFPPYQTTSVYLRGAGQEAYSGYDPVNPISRASLVKVTDAPVRYERRLTDGTVEVFELPDRASTLPARRIFLTSVIDPQGHVVEFTYDSSFRLVAIEDALGQVTVLAYENAADPELLTKVTDPFGRFATLGYDPAGRLNSITDAAGMTSTFSYGQGDFIASMTTPYGTTTFRHEPGLVGSFDRWIEATDPVGGRERLEFHFHNATLSATVASGDVPTGFSASNVSLDYWNTFYWDKQAMAVGAGDLTKAVQTNWMQVPSVSYGHAMTRNVPHSIKRPLESRVWYRYPNQDANSHHSLAVGGTQPALIGRVLDGGASQITAITYNTHGMVTTRIDPAGRQTNYTYATNGLDLLQVEQVRGGGTDVIQAYSNYSNHLPGTITDAAGQDTDFTYNSAGQPLTVTNAKNETTTYTYETGTNNLLTVTGPVSGATTTYVYDAYGHVESTEDADGYSVVTDYDPLHRVTQRTYPDDTTETFTYSRLDLTQQKDRLGRITRHFHDGFGRRIATRDPAGRTISQVWCDCGSMDALIDANGNRTKWERDVQGRVTREIRADNTTDTLYTYDLSGRLKTVTDPKDQVTTQSYNIDDSLSGTAYTNEVIDTPNVSYTYDPYYARVATMVDGIGTTSYAYKSAGTNGAGQIASVDGPLSNDTITYTYDELGRVTVRAINGSANTATWTFDALGRVASEANLLGTFDYTYDGVTSRLATVTYPNGQTSAYTYFNNPGDRRLQTIHHKYPNTSTLSKFDYTYDAVGNILTWRQQADTTAVLWEYGYDQADQLTSAIKKSTATPATILQRFAYAYDPAGNRTVEQIDDAVTLSAYDNLNRLTGQAPGGPIVIMGALNEPGTVTISGVSVTVDSGNNFRGIVPTTTGTNAFAIVAKDATGNTTTEQYEVDIAGNSRSFSYDANGNLTTDGARIFGWDARNALTAAEVGDDQIDIERDGRGRATRRIVTSASTVISDRGFLWCDVVLCSDNDSTTSQATARFEYGSLLNGTSNFIVRDQLRSVRARTNTAGAKLATVDYDPFGRPELTGNVVDLSPQFTDHAYDEVAGLNLTLNRAYDPQLGRWISEDPAGFVDGPNLYDYVGGKVTVAFDPFGLQSSMGPMPPPDEPKPEGCRVTPWKFVSVAQQVTQQKLWKRASDFGPSLLGPSPSAGRSGSGRMMFDDSSIGKCKCDWVLEKVVEFNDIVRTWERNVTCGACGASSTKQTVEQVKHNPPRDIARIEPAGGVRRRTDGWYLGSGCFCLPPKS